MLDHRRQERVHSPIPVRHGDVKHNANRVPAGSCRSALLCCVSHSTSSRLAWSPCPLAAPVLSYPQAPPERYAKLLRDLASGSPVHLVPADAELTTQQAADLLGISRAYVVRLVDQGDLPAHLVGSHRRLLAANVLTYRQKRQDRLDAVASITDADLELGVRY